MPWADDHETRSGHLLHAALVGDEDLVVAHHPAGYDRSVARSEAVVAAAAGGGGQGRFEMGKGSRGGAV